MDFLERYLRGEHEQVWADLRELGPSVRDPSHLGSARGVALETMRRVRSNVEVVRRRLDEAGYRFHQPDEVHVPPAADAGAQLDRFEERHGPLPLSLRAFYEIVGAVNLTQSRDQFVTWLQREQSPQPVPQVEYLGEYDPLMVEPLICEHARWDADHGRRMWFLAPDECLKANYSGAMGYHVLLPDAGADFRIYGMITGEDDFGDHFVGYLRETFRGGGFRRALPDMEITRHLAEGLLPIGVPNDQPRLFPE